MALSLLAGCEKGAKEGSESAGTTDEVKTEVAESEPITQIPDTDELSEFEKLAKAYIRPYFDEAGSVTEKTVSPGDYFDIWIVAEFSRDYPVNAAEFRLIMPEGVSLMGHTQNDSILVYMGKPEHDVMMAFHCSNGPKMWMVKYNCKASEDFNGGTVQVAQGSDLNYLGFTMCDADHTMIRATAGQAAIRRR
jgi:hypothetical protein